MNQMIKPSDKPQGDSLITGIAFLFISIMPGRRDSWKMGTKGDACARKASHGPVFFLLYYRFIAPLLTTI